MSRDDIIRMAREAGGGTTWCPLHSDTLERFAALVAAAERERLKQSIRHSLTIGPKTIQTRVYFGEEEVSIVKMPIEEVVAAEREACAKVCDDMNLRNNELRAEYQRGLFNAALAIRARGQAA
jgi:hypothetical protein